MGCYRGTVLRPRGTWYVASANKPSPYQILPHTNSYVRCLYSYLDLLPQGPLVKNIQTAVETVEVVIRMG